MGSRIHTYLTNRKVTKKFEEGRGRVIGARNNIPNRKRKGKPRKIFISMIFIFYKKVSLTNEKVGENKSIEFTNHLVS